MLIDMERVEFYHPRAMNCMRYLARLLYIADNEDKHPTYTADQLEWWLGVGGIPGNYLHHGRHDEQPLERNNGIERKFKNVILPRIRDLGLVHRPIKVAKLGKYAQHEALYQGYGYAEGIHLDPHSMKSAVWDMQSYYSVIEIKGNGFPPLPIKKAEPRTLENQLLAGLRSDGKHFWKDDKKFPYPEGHIECNFVEPMYDLNERRIGRQVEENLD